MSDLRDGREHALVDGVNQIGNPIAAHRRTSEHVSEPNVGEVTDERAGAVGEGERVAPEEPLEGDEGRGHDREPYQRQSRFPSSETGVEEASQRSVGSSRRMIG